ncbi:Reverse transcriptase domain-containing protein [Raphanus sativus]|nr:Reverse transcriptase domain-containing protein [Raphanus sativus]
MIPYAISKNSTRTYDTSCVPANSSKISTTSGERRSALNRLSGAPTRVPLLQNGVANSDSGRLQEVNIQYLEDALPYQTPPEHMRPSSSKMVVAGSVQNPEEKTGSPIRTLSEDRAHVSLRLGSLPPDESPLSVLAKTSVRSKIVEWTKRQNQNSRELIQTSQAQLETALSASTPDPDLILSLQGILSKAYAEEEEYWRQRSRIQWLSCGDKNSSFFHSVTRGRRALNKFAVIEDETGNAFFEEKQITQTIASFYQDIFSSRSTGDLSVVREVLTPKVTPEMNHLLIAVPSDLEIKQAVFSINVDKAPGDRTKIRITLPVWMI